MLAKIISIYIALGKKTGVEIFQPTAINSIVAYVEHFHNNVSLFSLSSSPLKTSSYFLIAMLSLLCFSSPGAEKAFPRLHCDVRCRFFGTTEGNLEDKSFTNHNYMGALSRCHCERRYNLVKIKNVNKQGLNLPMKRTASSRDNKFNQFRFI